MSALKTLAGSLLAWAAMGSLVQAEPFSSGSWKWTTWLPGEGVIQSSLTGSTNSISATYPTPPPSDYNSGFSIGAATTNQPAPAVSWTPPAYVPPAPTVISSPPPAAPVPSSAAPADAFINLGNGPYPEASLLTTGSALPWYDSPSAVSVFGGIPNGQQQADFANKVLQDVSHTYQLSGISAHFTLDPHAAAAHTLSVVSNTSYPGDPSAIGITDVGYNGYGFIDKLNYAHSVDELAWAVAHNVSHELMHAFGIAVHHDTSGAFLDAATANWSMLTSPSTTFSPAAVQDLLSHNLQAVGNPNLALGGERIDGNQTLVQPVPEPTTLAVWALAGSLLVLSRRLPMARLA